MEGPRSTTLPDLIVDHMVAQILTGQLSAGDRLPPYRKLAAALGVDQTSLRAALRVLDRMNLVRSVQGSGITVNDYRRSAGLDLLDAMFRIEALELGRDLLEAGLSIFNRFVPILMRDAMAQIDAETMLDVSSTYRLLLDTARRGGTPAALAALDVKVVDTLAASLDDTYLRMVVNSSRRLRLGLTRRMLASIDAVTHYEVLLDLFARHQAGSLDSTGFERDLRSQLQTVTQVLRREFEQLPAAPYLTAPILDPDRMQA